MKNISALTFTVIILLMSTMGLCQSSDNCIVDITLPDTTNYVDRDFIVSVLDINASGKNVQYVEPGSQISFRIVWNSVYVGPTCPDCLQQFYIGLDDDASFCLISAFTGQADRSGDDTFTFTAPMASGTYYFKSDQSLQLGCTLPTQYPNTMEGTLGAIVVDEINPIITCKDTTITLQPATQITLTPEQMTTNLSDNCGIDTAHLSQSVFNAAHKGINTIQLYAEDYNENIDSCSSTVSIAVLENCTQSFSIPDTTEYAERKFIINSLDINSSGRTVAFVSPGSTVNVDLDWASFFDGTFCPPCQQQFYIGLDTFTSTCLYDGATNNPLIFNRSISFTAPTEPGVYYFKSAHSLEFSCTLPTSYPNDSIDAIGAIYVGDIAPTAICRSDTTLFIVNGASVTLFPQDLDRGSFDNCVIDTMYLNKSNFTTADAGENIVYLYAQDEAGNIDSCATIVTVSAFDDCSGAFMLPIGSGSCTQYLKGTTNGATDSGVPHPCFGFQGDDVWYKFIVPASGQAILEIKNLSLYFNFTFYKNNCSDLTFLGCDGIDSDETKQKLINFAAPGDTVFLAVWDSDSNQDAQFELCVFEVEAPLNDDCQGATLLAMNSGTCSTSTISSLNGATDSGIPHSSLFYRGGDVWFKMEVPPSGAVLIETSNDIQTSDTELEIYAGACGSLTSIAGDESAGQGDFSRVVVGGLTAGDTIYAAVWHRGGRNIGSFRICATEVETPANDECSGATLLPVGSEMCENPIRMSNAFASDSRLSHHCGNYQGGDLWYKLVVPPSGNLIIETNNSNNTNFDTALEVYDACGSSLTSLGCIDDGPHTTLSTFALSSMRLTNMPPDDTLYVAVWVYNNDQIDSFSICAWEVENLTIPINAPIIVTTAQDERSANGLTSFREAIDSANAQFGTDTILFASHINADTIVLNIGTTHEDNNQDGDLDISDPSGLVIMGNGRSQTIIDGNHTERIFHHLQASLTITNLTMYNGFEAHNNGGAIESRPDFGDLTVIDCDIKNNQADGGSGGIYTTNSLFSKQIKGCNFYNNQSISGGAGGLRFIGKSYGEEFVIDCIFENNSARRDGGALESRTSSSSIRIENCEFLNNHSNGDGGAFDAEGTNGIVLINNCSFIGNSCSGDGGAITADATDGFLTTSNSVIAYNTAENGGGIESSGSNDGRLEIYNTTISHNQSLNHGGAIYNNAKNPILLNHVTLAFNIADSNQDNLGDGGGINMKTDGNPSLLTVQNSIIQHNQDLTPGTPISDDCDHDHPGFAQYLSLGGNVFGSNTGCPVTDADTTGAALLAPLAHNGGLGRTNRLMTGSSAINYAVPTSDQLLFDQRGSGFARSIGPGRDAGAYEYGTCIPSYTAVNNNNLIGILQPLALYHTNGIIESSQMLNPDTSNTALSEIIYNSGTTIELQPGFEVGTGVQFNAMIDGCIED